MASRSRRRSSRRRYGTTSRACPRPDAVGAHSAVRSASSNARPSGRKSSTRRTAFADGGRAVELVVSANLALGQP
ncbi:hypothetical protein [Streptomyces abikoensis]|uniref:hypothetical protein n=1 Tax=Streptomyces abikoensis TaxID=97398 RepID=UPI001E2F2B01|nr:hypothetical protein [Streptomyces abikoensis]